MVEVQDTLEYRYIDQKVIALPIGEDAVTETKVEALSVEVDWSNLKTLAPTGDQTFRLRKIAECYTALPYCTVYKLPLMLQ